MKRTIILVCVLLLLLMLAQSVYGMSSPAYRIEWLNLLSGSGGPASSAGYQVNFTVGQTVSSASANPQYRVQMGYWAGIIPRFSAFLPKVVKSP